MTIDDCDRLLKKAEDFESVGKHNEAIKIYDEILMLSPKNAKVLAFRGYGHFQLKNYECALNDFNKALKLKKNAPSTLFYRARTFEHLGQLNKALTDYLVSADLSPEVDVFINIALIKKYQNKISDAKTYLEKAKKLEPDNQLIKKLLNSLTLQKVNEDKRDEGDRSLRQLKEDAKDFS